MKGPESGPDLSRRMCPNRRFGATYSPCGRYRYRLWRSWDGPDRTILWIMLNPSTADDLGNNDPTIERCERRSIMWGFNRLEVVNLFGFRTTNPQGLLRQVDPVGPDNDLHILLVADSADLVVCGWGALGRYRSRSATVRALLAARPLHCLGRTRSGEPSHPLYLPYDHAPLPYPDDEGIISDSESRESGPNM